MTDHLDGQFLQMVALLGAEGLGRSDHDGLTCMDAERVEVLHITYSDAIVVLIPYNLIFHFFPTLEGFLNQDLVAIGKCL